MNTTNDPQYPIYAPIFVGIIYLMQYLAARTKLDNPILRGGNILPAIASLRIILHRKAITGISCWNCEVAIAQNGTKRPDPQPPSRTEAPPPLVRADFFATVYLEKQIQNACRITHPMGLLR
jgi:hypothetical protein